MTDADFGEAIRIDALRAFGTDTGQFGFVLESKGQAICNAVLDPSALDALRLTCPPPAVPT